MYSAYAKKLSLAIQKTDISAWKIDVTILETFEIIITAFSVYDKAEKVCFFEKTVLLPNINMDVILEILFLTLSNVDI